MVKGVSAGRGAEGLLSGDLKLLSESQDEPGHLGHGHCAFWLLSLCLATYFRLIANISLENGPALPPPHTKIVERQSSQGPS